MKPIFQRRSARQSGAQAAIIWDSDLASAGYTRLIDCPAVQSAVGGIADIVSNAPIQLLRNTPDGDIRVKNDLSAFVDHHPYRWGGRKQLIQWTVTTLLTDGNGEAFWLPTYDNGALIDLSPMPDAYSADSEDYGQYHIVWRGAVYQPDEVLHFVYRPDPRRPWKGTGLKASLREVSKNLSQASATRRGFLASRWKPPLVVKVNSDAEGMETEAGRKRIEESYLQRSETGAPWIIPADLMEVSQVKPLSLTDLAISDNVEIDSRAVASIVGVTPYMVGVGAYNDAEHNHMIKTTAASLANTITQEMTSKLLLDPSMYFKVSTRRLYAYSLQELSNVGANLYVRGIMDGNEVRDWMELSPREGLSQLVMLENYIPAGMIGQQKKLKEEGDGSDE